MKLVYKIKKFFNNYKIIDQLYEENLKLQFKLGLLEVKMGQLYQYNPETGLCDKETDYEKLIKENEQLKEQLKVKETMKSKKQLDSFIEYCSLNPDQRFWQALLNWSCAGFILYVPRDRTIDNYIDTYYWDGENANF